MHALRPASFSVAASEAFSPVSAAGGSWSVELPKDAEKCLVFNGKHPWNTLWLCQNSYWKWICQLKIVIFHSYVSLPEGRWGWRTSMSKKYVSLPSCWWLRWNSSNDPNSQGPPSKSDYQVPRTPCFQCKNKRQWDWWTQLWYRITMSNAENDDHADQTDKW